MGVRSGSTSACKVPWNLSGVQCQYPFTLAAFQSSQGKRGSSFSVSYFTWCLYIAAFPRILVFSLKEAVNGHGVDSTARDPARAMGRKKNTNIFGKF